MYLSTIFLSEIENGAERATLKCNEEFLKRLTAVQDYSASFLKDSANKVFHCNVQCDEIMALWDVFKDFKDEVLLDLPVINAMNSVRTARGTWNP